MRVPEKKAALHIPEYQGGERVYVGSGGGNGAHMQGMSDAAGRIGGRDLIGAQLEALGQAGVRAGVTAEKLYMDYQSTKAKEAFLRYETEADALQAELDQLKGENALSEHGVRERLRTFQSEAHARLSDGLGEPARRMFEQAVLEANGKLNNWGLRKIGKELVDYQNGVDEGRASQALQRALRDPNYMPQAAGILKEAYGSMGHRSGWAPEFQQAKYDEALTKMQEGAITAEFNRRLAADDLEGAEALLRDGGGKFTGSLPADVVDLAEKEAAAQGLDPELVKAVIMQESGGNQSVVSHAGAQGLMQLVEGTAKDLGVDPKDPAQNVRGGVTYLAQMLKRYGGDMENALTAYNWGLGNMDAYLKTGKGINGQPMPKEAREYAARVLGRMGGGGMGSMGGMLAQIDPVKLSYMQSRLQTQTNRRNATIAAGYAQNISERAMYLPAEERAAYAYKQVDNIPDPTLREIVRTSVVADMVFDKKKQDAQAAATISQFSALVQERQMPPSQAQAEVAKLGLTEDDQNLAMERAFGKLVENSSNRAALDAVRVGIDRGEITTKEQVELAGRDARMTTGQIKSGLSYLEGGGRENGLKISNVLSLYKQVAGKDIKKLPDGLYDSLLNVLPLGKVPTEKEVRAAIATAIMDGGMYPMAQAGTVADDRMTGRNDGWFNGSTYYEAVAEDKAKDWLPDITNDEYEAIKAEVNKKGQNIIQTKMQAREYKKYRLLGIMRKNGEG